MKKLLFILTSITLLTLSFVSCDLGNGGSGQGKSDPIVTPGNNGTTGGEDTNNETPGEDKPSLPTVNLNTFKFHTNHPWNEGKQDMEIVSNYQAEIVVTETVGKLVKDSEFTVVLNGTSDIDIPAIYVRAIDNSEAANWWKELDVKGDKGTVLAENVKANEKFEAKVNLKLNEDPVQNIALCIWYAAEVGKEATITVEKTEDAIPVILNSFSLTANHPWVDGKEDTENVINYQKNYNITGQTGLLKAGDKITISFKGKSDIDIPQISVRVVDNSSEADNWKELDAAGTDGTVLVENVVANEEFEANVTLTLNEDCVGNVTLCIWYSPDVKAEANISI